MTVRFRAFALAQQCLDAIEHRGMIADVRDVALQAPARDRLFLLWELLCEIRRRAATQPGPTGSVFAGTRCILVAEPSPPPIGDDDLDAHDPTGATLHACIQDLLGAYCRDRPQAVLDAAAAQDMLHAPEVAAQVSAYFLGAPRWCTACAASALTLVTSDVLRARMLTACAADARLQLREPCTLGASCCPEDAWAVALWCLAQLPRNDDIVAHVRQLAASHPHALAAYRDRPKHRSVIALLDAAEGATVIAFTAHRSAS